MMRNKDKETPGIGKFIIKVWKRLFPMVKFKTSEQYWVDRYKKGGDSGFGSYNHFAQFKKEIINTFVKENNVKTVMEFGCGDGNQLQLFNFESYIGYDVSKLVIDKCKSIYKDSKTKSFYLIKDYVKQTVDLTLSLDVIYHLVEDETYYEYMNRLFDSSHLYVIVYSSNYEDYGDSASHVKHRKFTGWIEKNKPQFELMKFIPNKYPRKNGNSAATSVADFFIYKLKKQ